jgi:S1-C subfamily serine protease
MTMKRKSQKHWILVITVLLLLFVGAGCSLTSVLGVDPTPVPATVSPTATMAPPVVLSIPDEHSDEIEAINALESQVIAVHKAVSPAVVNITNRGYAYDMFMRAVPQEGSGSGFVYDTEGHIVTNYHVVENAEELLVTLANGQVYEAKVVGVDPANDLAVIRIDAGADLPEPVALGDSDQLRVGQFVLAIGNPFGLEQTLTTGVVSALGRVIESPDGSFIGEAIQTDAAINPGNSGGPLIDLQGNVIGVNSQIISTSGTSSGVGFAVSVNTVRRVVPELISRGYYPHPWLNTQMLTLTPATAEVLREAGMNVPVDTGLLVIEAVRGGPADKAGIRGGDRVVRIGRYQIPLGGDIIIAVNGEPVNDFQDLTVYLETETIVGDTVELTIIRDGEEQAIAVTLEERPQM